MLQVHADEASIVMAVSREGGMGARVTTKRLLGKSNASRLCWERIFHYIFRLEGYKWAPGQSRHPGCCSGHAFGGSVRRLGGLKL